MAEQVIDQMQRDDQLIVVDDTAGTPDAYDWLGSRGRSLGSNGQGPAVARNLGWRAASGEIVAFTDDDVCVDRRWLGAIRSEFADDPTLVAVEGHTLSREFDPLYEYSVQSDGARNGLTCNVSYRRQALERLQGFDEGFRFAHCEDVDLFTRARRLGPVKFSLTMTVDHEPRRIVPAAFARRGGWLASERRLYAKHPDLRGYRLTPGMCAIVDYLRWPLATLFSPPGASLLRDPVRLRRALVIASLWWCHALKAIPALVLSRRST